MYRSLNGNPSLFGQVEFLADVVYGASGTFESAGASLKLYFDVLLDDLSASIEQSDGLACNNVSGLGQEGVADTGIVSDDDSEVAADLSG
jgi:hypothetical protein